MLSTAEPLGEVIKEHELQVIGFYDAFPDAWAAENEGTAVQTARAAEEESATLINYRNAHVPKEVNFL